MPLSSGLHTAWREFRAQPWVSAVAVVTLALGMAGATTMFTAIGGVVSQMTPPGADPSRVARVVWMDARGGGRREPLTGDEFVQLSASTTAFDALAAATERRVAVGGDGRQIVTALATTSNVFSVFGCTARAGRLFDDADVRGGARVAVVGESVARRLPGLALGRVVSLGGDDHVVIGVVPESCWFPSPGSPDLWLPLPTSATGVPLVAAVTVVGRLRTGDARDLAQSQADAVGRRVVQATAPGATRVMRVITLGHDARTRTGFGLIGLLAPAIVVLLIACGNVANLLLARATSREREMALRAALGATPARLVRERLAESAWLGVAGGALGLPMAWAGIRLLRLWIGSFDSARTAAGMVRLDRDALLFAGVVIAMVPIAVGLVPAVAASRIGIGRALQHVQGQARPRRGPYGSRELLVIVEIALAVVLVVTTAMIARFVGELHRVDWGFDPARVLAVQVSLDAGAQHRTTSRRRIDDLVAIVGRLPGVVSVAAGEPPGLSEHRGSGSPIEFEGCANPGGARVGRTVLVDDAYFATLGLTPRRGRGIGAEDDAGAPLVGVISARHAEQCWPRADPIGRRFRTGMGGNVRWMTVVGVVPDTMRTKAFPNGDQPVYVAAAQAGEVPGTMLVRADRDPIALATAVRAAIRRADPSQPADRIGRLDEVYREQTRGASWLIGVLGACGIFALGLGALGVFSVTSYMVAERTREFGIRVALGASRSSILALVGGRVAIIVAIGATVSIAGTLAVTRVTFPELVDLAATDPALWAAVTTLLALVAVGASLVPARRATRVDPAVALRAE